MSNEKRVPVTSPAEPLTLDRLLRTACQVALNGRSDTTNEDRAVERVQALLTPAARLELIADLAKGLPGWSSGTIHMDGDEAVALVQSIPGYRASRWVHPKRVHEGGRADIGRLQVFGAVAREPLPDECAALAAKPAEPATCVMLPAPATLIHRPEAGVILPELLVAIGVIAAVCALVAGVAAAASPAWICALLGAVGMFALFLYPLKDLAPSWPPKPPRRAEPPRQPAVEESRPLPSGVVPVEVPRLNAPLPPRPRRSAVSGPHPRPRSDRGAAGMDLLCILGCIAIVVFLASVALSAMGGGQ